MPEDKSITIPNLHVDTRINPICIELTKLSRKAETVNILYSFRAFRALWHIHNQRKNLRNEYETKIEECYKNLTEPVQGGPLFIIAQLQTWSSTLGTSALIRLQSTWNELSSIIDRKTAYSVAILSLYVAVLSFVATVVIGILTLAL